MERNNLIRAPEHQSRIRVMENRLYQMMSDLGGMEIPLNQPSRGSQNKRLRVRNGDRAADFPDDFVVDEPLNDVARVESDPSIWIKIFVIYVPKRAAIIAAVRTPIGRYGGSLSSVRPDDLAAHVIRAVVDQSGIDPTSIDDVYFGAANQSGEDNRNVARMASLLAGLPESVPGVTVNRRKRVGAGSDHIAARMIESSQGEIYLAGGVESMSRAPYVVSKSNAAFGRSQEMYDTSIGWRFVHPKMEEMGHTDPLGITAETVAQKYGIGREAQDRQLQSQQRWASAQDRGLFADELVPVSVPQAAKGTRSVNIDEHPRPSTTAEDLAKQCPAFTKDPRAR